jgi:hypothetical protein
VSLSSRASVVDKKFRKAHAAFITFDSMYPARAPPQPFIDPHVMRIEAAPGTTNFATATPYALTAHIHTSALRRQIRPTSIGNKSPSPTTLASYVGSSSAWR